MAQECATEPVTVGFLPKLDTDPYFQVAKTGAEEAAERDRRQGDPAGAVAGDRRGADRVHQQSGRRRRSDVIAIAGNDANAVAPALKRAAAQGVGVISYDFDVAPAARARCS